MSSHRLTSILRRFYVFQFLSGFHFFSAVLVAMYTDWSTVGLAVGQSLQSWFTLNIFLLEVPTGVIADSWGRKHSLALGCLVMAVATLVYGSFPYLPLFILAEFMFATGVALISGADKALVYDTLLHAGKEDLSKSVWGKARSYHLAGIMVAGPLGSILAGRFGINIPMLATCIPIALAALLAWSLPEPPRLSPPSEPRHYLKLAKDSLSYLMTHKVLRRWTINSTLVAAAGYFVLWLYQTLMGERLDIPLAYFGLAHAGMVASEIFFSRSHARWERLFGSPQRFYLISALLTSLSLLLAGIFPSLLTLVLLLVFGGGLGLTRMEFMTVHMNKYIDSHNRATVNSGISMYRRVLTAVLNPVVGLVTQSSVTLALVLVAVLPLIALLFPLNGDSDHSD